MADASATPVAIVTAGPTPTPTPTPPPPPFVASDWGRVAVPAFADRYGTTSMRAVAVSGATVVAVGSGPRGAAAWWTGPDGTWRQALDDPSFQGAKMTDVVATSSGFVAVGQHGDEAAAWTSTDGASWIAAAVAAAGADPNSESGSLMLRVATGPQGLVAIGPGKETETGPAEWSSTDGRDWSIAADPIPGVAAATDIGVLPDGRYVILGASPDGSETSAGAWTSTDARSWTPMPSSPISGLTAFVPWRGGIVAVGGDEKPVIYDMASNGEWSVVEHVPGSETEDRSVYVTAITATADRLIATGASPKGVVGIWSSEDGMAWTLADSPGLNGPEGEFEPSDIAAAGSQIVVVGDFPNHDASFTWSASVWTNPAPERPAPTTPVAVAHPCPTTAPALIDVAEMTPDERLGCFSRRDLTLRGYLGQYSDPGVNGDPPKPTWLADDTACCRPFMPLAGMPQDVVYLAVAFDPSRQRALRLPDGAAIEVTGHFDDARSKSCRGGGESTRKMIQDCRLQFVVMNFKTIDEP